MRRLPVLPTTTLVIVTLVACRPVTPVPMTVPCGSTVAQMAALTQNLRNPFTQNNTDNPGVLFDANKYLTILHHLHLGDNYVLDYVYRRDSVGGEPHLYVRPRNKQPYHDYREYVSSGESDSKYLDAIAIDDTPAGYVQLVILHVMGDQFYLYWHARYNDAKIIWDSARMEELLCSRVEFGGALPPHRQQEARQWKVEPSVERTGHEARVQLVVFTKWGGFLRRTYAISRRFPHRILEDKTEVLVPYHCGVSL